MLKYSIKRLLQSLLTVLIITTIVFLLLRMLSTDYFFTEEELIKYTEQQKHDILLAQGYLDPPLTQLMRFYKQLLSFDLGISKRLQQGTPIVELIGDKFSLSMAFGCLSLVISLVIGATIGLLQARYKNSVIDHFGTAYTVFANAVPMLVVYSLILILGSRYLKLPSMYSTKNPIMSGILPLFCLVLSSTAHYMMWMRRYAVDELNKDYLKLARATGKSSNAIMFKDVLRNAFVPMTQFLPQAFLTTIGGSLLVEKFFSVPGMGPLLTEAIGRYDTGVVQALVMLYASLGILGIFLGDVLMMIVDPRIRITGKEGSR